MSISEWSKVTHQDSYLWFNLRHVHIRVKISILYIWIKLCILPFILYSLKLYLYLNIYILYPTFYPVPLYLYLHYIQFCILHIILYPLYPMYLYLNIYIFCILPIILSNCQTIQTVYKQYNPNTLTLQNRFSLTNFTSLQAPIINLSEQNIHILF